MNEIKCLVNFLGFSYRKGLLNIWLERNYWAHGNKYKAISMCLQRDTGGQGILMSQCQK